MTSAPRLDELNALNALIEFLKVREVSKLPEVVYEPNGPKTAPDYLIKLTSHSVMVEVRNLGDGFLVLSKSNDLEPKERYERSAAAMIDKIENIVKTWIDPSETIILMITSAIPLEQRGRLAKKIANQLENAYRNRAWLLDQRIKFSISTDDSKVPIFHIEAKLTNFYGSKIEYSPVKEILGSALQTPNPVLQATLSEQARYSLFVAISEKREKLSHLDGEKWLVLINNNPLLEDSLYSEALTSILERNGALKTAFSKIFLVDGGIAQELVASRSQNDRSHTLRS
jgi:hypothetical protein